MKLKIFTPSKPGLDIISLKAFLYAVLFPFLSRKFSRKKYQQLSTVIDNYRQNIDKISTKYRQVIDSLSITFLVLAAAVPNEHTLSVPELSPYNPWKTVQALR